MFVRLQVVSSVQQDGQKKGNKSTGSSAGSYGMIYEIPLLEAVYVQS